MPEDVRYHRVTPTIWQEPWSHDAKVLALYLLTCEHRTTEGLFRLPKLYAQADMDWSAERLDQAWAELVDVGFVECDEATSVVLIVKALKYQAPANPNGVKAAVKQLALVPKSPLDARFRQLAERYCERLAEGLPERFGEQSGEPPAPSPAPSPTTNTQPPRGADAPQAQADPLDDVDAAIVDVCGWSTPNEGTRPNRKVKVAAAGITRSSPDVDPTEIRRRAGNWPDSWGVLTPNALDEWWEFLDTAHRPDTPKPAEPPTAADEEARAIERRRAAERAAGIEVPA